MEQTVFGRVRTSFFQKSKKIGSFRKSGSDSSCKELQPLQDRHLHFNDNIASTPKVVALAAIYVLASHMSVIEDPAEIAAIATEFISSE